MRIAKRRNQRGFTLIELMIVIVIIGILATLLIPRIMERPEEARRIKAKADIKTIESALKLYKIDSGTYPTTEQGLEALIKKPETSPVPKKWREGGYLEGNAVPKDPWSNTYYYTSPGPDGRDYEIISYGNDGEPGGTGRDADVSSSDLGKD
jgi:general secretion pathway protein G